MEPMKPELKKEILDQAAKAFSNKTREELECELEEYIGLVGSRFSADSVPEQDLKRLQSLYDQFKPFMK